MSKKKEATKEKIAPLALEDVEIEDKLIDPEGILGDKEIDTEEDEDALDDEEIDPFGDKWEQ